MIHIVFQHADVKVLNQADEVCHDGQWFVMFRRNRSISAAS